MTIRRFVTRPLTKAPDTIGRAERAKIRAQFDSNASVDDLPKGTTEEPVYLEDLMQQNT